ncbi:MAG: alpha/beta hydrolase [Rhodobacteraceae bacterium]|nr:MAG: alpha/beta hydrolase [Paracoccaceae bacterium]
MIADCSFSDEGPPALMLHCMLGRARDWQRLLAGLRTPLAARSFDLPGHGRSDSWDGEEDLHALCTGLARERCGPVDVVIGHSFGATLALRLALEVGSALRALVLIEPVLFAAACGTPEAAAQAPHDAALADAFAREDYHAAARGFLAQWSDGPPFDALPPEQQARIAARMEMVRATAPVLNEDSAGLLRPGGLERLELPVLLLRGSGSPAVTGAINRALAARLPWSDTAIVQGAGHMAPITHPRETAALIDPFLAKFMQ